MNLLNIRINYALRTIPLLIYGLLILYSSLILSFDFWTPMINISKNILDWFLAGSFNVILIFAFLYIRLLLIRFSFQDLNERIPHSDLWEHIQFYITILFVVLVVFNGLMLTVFLITSSAFELIQKLLILVPFFIDLLFHLKWIIF